MAKYNIAYSCGHTVEKQLFGKHVERERYMAWASESGHCPACAKADKLKAVEAVEVENELPVLSGSEKQIAWARQIRADKFVEITTYFDGLRKKVLPEKVDEFESMIANGVQKLAGNGAAAWWIDNRHHSGFKIGMDSVRAST